MGEIVGAITADRCRISTDRLERLVELHERKPPPQFRAGIVVGNPRGILEILERDAVTAEVKPGNPPPQVELRVHRVEPQARGTGLERSLEVTHMAGHDAESKPGHGELGILFDRLENQLLRLLVLPLPVEFVGLDEEFPRR